MATWYVNKSGWNATRVFTVSGISVLPLAGDTYTNNSITYTVVGTTTSGTAPSISGYVFCTGSGAPTASGTLTKTIGNGDATITFSAYQAGGTSTTAAYLTIQGMANVAATNDSIIVGSGLYNEKVAYSSKSISFYADGNVVLDGTGLAAGYLFNAVQSYVSFAGYNSVGKWIFQNNNGSAILNCYSTLLINCTFYCSGNTYAVSCLSNANSHIMTNCVFSGQFTNAIYDSNLTYSKTVIISNCTFYNNVNSIYVYSPNATINLFNNIFSNCTTAWYLLGSINAQFNQYFNITNWKYSTTIYTAFSGVGSVQAAGYDLSSIYADPQFTDAANNIFYLKSVSSIGANIGAYPYGFTCGAANDVGSSWNIVGTADVSGPGTGWYNSDGNVTKEGGTGYFILSSGSVGVVVSPVYDLGAILTISGIDLESTQLFPTNMVDTTKTDVRPNYQTIEMRVSVTSFNQADVSPTWTEVKSNALISPLIAGRYLQLRLTLRNDDVGA
jgi:hypothetical protein